MNNMAIKVKIKNVYGVTHVYPICNKAKAFANIAGKKTLTTHTLSCIKELGYTIELQHDIDIVNEINSFI